MTFTSHIIVPVFNNHVMRKGMRQKPEAIKVEMKATGANQNLTMFGCTSNDRPSPPLLFPKQYMLGDLYNAIPMLQIVIGKKAIVWNTISIVEIASESNFFSLILYSCQNKHCCLVGFVLQLSWCLLILALLSSANI